MMIGYTDSALREFVFRLEGDHWKCSITGSGFAINGTMPAVRDWQGELIANGRALYRMGAGAGLYTMTVQDEAQLEAEHLSFLEQTGRHISRIKKSRGRLDWLMRLQERGVEFMDAEWPQGSEVAS